MALANRLSTNRKTTRTQAGGYDVQKWNDADLNEDAVLLEEMADAVDANTLKTGITAQQASDITANNAKTGITAQQASDITANNAKTGITAQQASDITNNNAKTSFPEAPSNGSEYVRKDGAWSVNSGGSGPADTDALNEGSTNLYYTEARVSANSAVAANTAKTGITAQQASDITANNAKTGITAQQASDITANNAKTGITAQQASDITTNNAKISYSDAVKVSGIEDNATADQTGAEIKTALFAESDCNNFDDSSSTKLAGIQAGAELNVSPKHLSDYATFAAMKADQSNQKVGWFYYELENQAYWELKTKTASDSDYRGGGTVEETVVLSLSDYTTDLATGTGLAYWIAPWACTVQSGIGACLVTAPTGASVKFDVNKNGTTMLTTNKFEIEVSENSTITATAQPTFTTTAIAKGDIISADIDQVGSTAKGKGGSITLTVTR
jgi:hypothetical protein